MTRTLLSSETQVGELSLPPKEVYTRWAASASQHLKNKKGGSPAAVARPSSHDSFFPYSFLYVTLEMGSWLLTNFKLKNKVHWKDFTLFFNFSWSLRPGKKRWLTRSALTSARLLWLPEPTSNTCCWLMCRSLERDQGGYRKKRKDHPSYHQKTTIGLLIWRSSTRY